MKEPGTFLDFVCEVAGLEVQLTIIVTDALYMCSQTFNNQHWMDTAKWPDMRNKNL